MRIDRFHISSPAALRAVLFTANSRTSSQTLSKTLSKTEYSDEIPDEVQEQPWTRLPPLCFRSRHPFTIKFEALFQDGSREVLLSLPRYDFNWQHTCRPTEPKRMPAGTWIPCTGGFDNTRANPANPNPRIPFRWGDQSFDEMFIGFMNVAEIPHSRQRLPACGICVILHD